MRKTIFLLLLFTFVFTTLSTIKAQDEFELVESVPLETKLNKSNHHRTSDVWLKMIKDAKVTIDIETFYFANKAGESLEKILIAIKDAANRGVQVRIIVDSSFYSNNDKSVDELEGIQNITIRKIPVSNLTGGVMHAKYFIIDNEHLFLGSQNMDWRALTHIHEIGTRIKNKEIARTFHEIFDTDWKLCEGSYYGLTNQAVNYFVNSDNRVTLNTNEYGKIVLYPAFSPPKINMQGLSSEEEELIKIIHNSKERLFIQIYSYSPKVKNESSYFKIDSALRSAAEKGVEIRIIFPDWAIKESSIDFIKDLSLVKNIKIKIISIPQHSSGFIPYSRVDHSKYFIADNNISWISTTNWEWSYFNNSRNATLIIDNNKVNDELSKVFDMVWESPYSNFVDVGKKYEPVKRN